MNPEPPLPMLPTLPASLADQPPLRVLIVDNDPDDLLTLRRLLGDDPRLAL